MSRISDWLDAVCDRERDQLALWLPVALGIGIACWFVIPQRDGWIAFILGTLGAALASLFLLGPGRMGRMLAVALVFSAIGCGLVWLRAESVAAVRLDRPQVAIFTGKIEHIELLTARAMVRLQVTVDPGQALPPRVRVNVDDQYMARDVQPGARIRIRARLMPPGEALLPGGYDFGRIAWFRGIGATGRALDSIAVLAREPATGFSGQIALWRAALTAHIERRLPGSPGGISAAFVTGDQGAITEEDAAAMRTAGLAHLLSISGLHVAVVIGGTMLLVMRMLALSQTLALRLPLTIIAAGAGALAGIAYTLIAGAEVPTLRSCIAAVLILIALVMGREAMTLRLVAAGAMLLLMLWPESLIGPSFQMSFAAVTVLLAVHQHPVTGGWFARRDESGLMRAIREAGATLLIGVAIEIALAPIALYHFHRTGLYGAVANIVAIPFTSFVIMPLEGLALFLDIAGWGAPIWWLVGLSMKLLIALAQNVSGWPGAVASLPTMPVPAFALMVLGGIWILLWKGGIRAAGIAPFAVGAIWAYFAPAPDLMIMGDGRHLALRGPTGELALLRPRAGDFVRDSFAESAAGVATDSLDDLPTARCSADFCVADIVAGGFRMKLLATRSAYLVDWDEMRRLCADADIAVSERRLPVGCTPRWLKADRTLLEQTGGISISFSPLALRTVRTAGDDHPWLRRVSALRHVGGDRGERKGH